MNYLHIVKSILCLVRKLQHPSDIKCYANSSIATCVPAGPPKLDRTKLSDQAKRGTVIFHDEVVV